MKKNIIIGALLLVLGFVIGILCKPKRIERVVDIQRDTTFLIDTHVIEKPVLVEKYIKDSFLVAVHDTTRIHDTLYLALPNETKVYWGDEYYAEVSGYNASLDYLELFTKTKVIRESVTNHHALGIGMEFQYLGNPYMPIYLEYSHLLQGNAELYARILYDLPSQSLGVGLGAKVSIGW
jgi:hypothetical protein